MITTDTLVATSSAGLTSSTLIAQFAIGGKAFPITLLTLFGFVGNLLFTLRMLIQWIGSEKQKQSVVPVSFWWISLVGTLVMIAYAYMRHELPFIIGYGVTMIPYIRSLAIHYRPDRPPRSLGPILMISVLLACGILAAAWAKQGKGTYDFWFIFGLLGNFIFMSRFLVAWIEAERTRQSVLPLSFWWVSLAGSTVLLIYSLVRGDLVFILGFIFNGIPYVRNIMLLNRRRGEPQVAASE